MRAAAFSKSPRSQRKRPFKLGKHRSRSQNDRPPAARTASDPANVFVLRSRLLCRSAESPEETNRQQNRPQLKESHRMPPKPHDRTRLAMLHLFAFSVVALSQVACRRPGQTSKTETKLDQPRIVIVYDRMWSINSAEDSSFSGCLSNVPQQCKENADLEEGKFYHQFASAFQLERACSGLSLFALNSPEGTSPTAYEMVSKVPESNQWMLNVSFRPGPETQQWSFGPMGKVARISGLGNAQLMARSVCSVANGSGGSLI